MKKINFILFFVFVWSSQTSFAGGLVGSGAGLMEMNFQYAYSNLAHWIISCQEENVCESGAVQGELFKRIVAVLQKNISRIDRLTFKSEKAEPEFFRTGVFEPNRIAKTELVPESTIYVNLNYLYSGDGNPKLELPQVAEVLVHELGHQAGEARHALLDIMAAQLRIYLDRTTLIYTFDLERTPQSNVSTTSEIVKMTVTNQAQPIQMSRMNFIWSNVYSIDLSSALFRMVKCDLPNSELSGYQLYNGYFLPKLDQPTAIDFNIWVKLNCFSNTDKKFSSEKMLLQFTLSSDKSVEVKKLLQ